jgi:hypothetical protein
MTRQDRSRDEGTPGEVADTGDGTGGSLGTGRAAASGGGTAGGVTDTGDGTGGSLGTGEGSKDGGGKPDKVARGISEAGKHPTAPDEQGTGKGSR